MLRKSGAGYKIRTRSGKMIGRKGGKPFRSKAAAVKRERQVRFFSNLRKSRGGKGSLAAKVRNKRLVKQVRGR
jgi:hypothetical protein